MAYRFYVTDVMRLQRGLEDLPRFYDLINPHEIKNADPQEIIERIMNGVNSL